MSVPPGGGRVVVVLDTAERTGRRLAESARGCGFEVQEVQSLDDLRAALSGPQHALLGLVAFEMLWPDPQRQLRGLRDGLAGVRLVVAYTEGSPRLRLGQRLWAVGLMDYFCGRETPIHELSPVLRQAYADARIEHASDDIGENPAADATRLYHRVRFLHNLGAAFTTQNRIEGLLRELASKLPSFIDYDLLGVLVIESKQPAFHVFQTRPVPHEVIWGLADETCTATSPFIDVPLSPQGLVFHESTSTSGADETDPVSTPSGSRNVLTLPMVLHGELIGCISLLLHDAGQLDAENRTILRLVAFHLATSLYNARILLDAESASLVDELTGTYNRRYLSRALGSEWRRAQRYQSELSVAMIDIDHFKSFNDVHGHLVGDEVLRALTSLVRQSLRETDHFVRYGGEEFLLLLPETGPEDAALVVERIRLQLARQPVYASETVGHLQVTFSAGIATFPHCTVSSTDELITLADQALLHAKRTGRNRVCVAIGGSIKTLEDLQKPVEKRRFNRVNAEFKVKYVEIPDFTEQTQSFSTIDVSQGGLSVRGGKSLQKNSYALVYMEDEEKPLLTQVAWTKTQEGGEPSAGLRFLTAKDFDKKELFGGARPRALVMVSKPVTRDLIHRVLKAAQYDAHFWEEGRELAPDELGRYTLIVVGDAMVAKGVGSRLYELKRAVPATVRIVVVNEESDRRTALSAIQSQKIEHLVGRDPASEETLFATLKKLLLGNYFGIKKYLLWGVETKSWHITEPERKQAVLDGIRDAAEMVNCHPRIADLLILAVDEMIINALYHPSKADANPKPVTIECGSDGRLFAVAVIDEYGLFRRENMFDAIARALESETSGLRPDAESGNLGFRIMLSALSHLVVNVDPGRCTEIIGLVDLRNTLRGHRTTAPGLGLFTKD